MGSGGLQNGMGVVKFYPYTKRGGGHNKFRGSFFRSSPPPPPPEKKNRERKKKTS